MLRAITRKLEGEPPSQEAVASPRGPEARIEGAVGYDSKGEAAEAPQPCTVEAICRANWPAQQRPSEAEQTALYSAATRGRMRSLPWTQN